MKENNAVVYNCDFLNRDVTYSVNDSLMVYDAFLDSLSYSEVTKRCFVFAAKRIHKLYLDIHALSDDILKYGLIELAKQIGKSASQKYTAYFYFLAMMRLMTIDFDDYFKTNPKTILKLDSWYSLYEEEIGFAKLIQQSKSIILKSTHRDYNWERDKKLLRKTCIFLMLHYNLRSILDLSIEQWNEYKKLLKNKVGVLSQNYTPFVMMQQASWELGIFDNRLDNHMHPNRGCTLTKEYIYDKMPNIKPITDAYKRYIIKKYSKATINHKFHDLECFCMYLNDRFGVDYNLSLLTRGTVHDYVSSIRAMEYSPSFKQGRAYAVKLFLEFVIANSEEFKKEGLLIPHNYILVKSDFKIKPIEYVPRPISSKLVDAFVEELADFPNERFKIFFMLMLTTGIPQREVLHLTRDCIKKIGNNTYEIFFYREKVKRYKIIKVDPVVYELVMALKEMNTQIKPLPHPSGKNVFYLFNDGGNMLTYIWYKRYFEMLKENVASKRIDLSEEAKGVKMHQLRHTFATTMRERGADIYTLSQLMGHENINTTRKYAKESDAQKIEMVKKMEEAFACEAISSLQSTLNGKGADKLLENMMSYHNKMGIGTCVINGYENCPMAHRCLDCIYLCSTKEDLPEMVKMLSVLKEMYNETKENGSIKRQIQRLCDKIATLRIPDVPVNNDTSIDTGILKFV